MRRELASVGAGGSADIQRQILSMIATGVATNKAAIVRKSGLARSTVTEYLERLRDLEIVVADGPAVGSGRGRPPQALRINGAAGVVLAADVGTTRTSLAVADANRRVLAESTFDCALSDGPGTALDSIAAQFDKLLAEAGMPYDKVRALAMGIPSPVDVAKGRPVHPPLMPGWDRYPVADTLAERFSTRVALDNDVNLMAIGEMFDSGDLAAPVLFLHISDGIGCGIVTNNGELLRGADGAAGDVGHLRSHGHDDTVCRCGNVGCIESVASVSAIAQRVYDRFPGVAEPVTVDVLTRMVRQGNPIAINEVRRAAVEIGEIAVTLVHVFNPASLILSGPLAEASDDLLAGVRAVVYRRALPLATRALSIAASTLGGRAAIDGAIRLATETAFL